MKLRTLKQWAAFVGTRRKRAYKWNRALHEYEECVVMRDIEALHGAGVQWVEPYLLRVNYPGRYTNTLKTVLHRLHRAGKLDRKRGGWTRREWSYKVRRETGRKNLEAEMDEARRAS